MRGSRVHHIFISKTSPSVKTYQTMKEAKHDPILDQAKDQVAKGRHAHAPVMVTCISPNLGDFSPVALRTVELITLTFKEMTSKQYF